MQDVTPWRGFHFRFHWSFWVVAVGLVLAKQFIALVGWAGLVLLHEAAHALVARAFRLQVLAIDLHGFGGACHYYDAHATPIQNGLIAWAGVAAQVLVLAIVWPLYQAAGSPKHGTMAQVAGVLVGFNLFTIVLNLIPLRPFDGARAWPLILQLLQTRGSPPPPPSGWFASSDDDPPPPTLH